MSIDEKLKLMNDAIADLQAEQIVHSWLLKEVYIDLANTFDDPDTYLSRKHEILSAKVDGIDLEKSGNLRFYVDEHFAYARKHSKAAKDK